MNKFTALKRYPKERDLCDWVDDWSRLDEKMEAIGVLERGLLASQFQEVQHKIDHAFATKWEGEDMRLKELVSKYRTYYKKRGFKYFTNRSVVVPQSLGDY